MGSLCMLDVEERVDPFQDSAIRLLSRSLPGLEELVLSAAVDEYTLMFASSVDDQEDSLVDFSPSPEAVRESLENLLVLKRFGWHSRVDPLDTLLAFPRSLSALRSLRLDWHEAAPFRDVFVPPLLVALSSGGAFQGLTELSLELPTRLCDFPDACGEVADVEASALPRLQRLHLSNTGTWGATVVRALAFPSLVELHLGSAIDLVDDGGNLRARCPALRRVQLSACAVAVTGLQALSLLGVVGMTLLGCSVYPRASHPWLVSLPGVTMFGCKDDRQGKKLEK